MPTTKLWSALEQNYLEFILIEAKKMEILFGMLCLWIMFREKVFSITGYRYLSPSRQI
jgi:hypothetical protein